MELYNKNGINNIKEVRWGNAVVNFSTSGLDKRIKEVRILVNYGNSPELTLPSFIDQTNEVDYRNALEFETGFIVYHDIVNHGIIASVFEACGVNMPDFATNLNEVIILGIDYYQKNLRIGNKRTKFPDILKNSFELAKILTDLGFINSLSLQNSMSKIISVEEHRLQQVQVDIFISQEFSQKLKCYPDLQNIVKLLNSALQKKS